MNNFIISRINTSLGIYRISGYWGHEDEEDGKIDVSSIEVMGTDGWVLLNHTSDNVMNIISALRPALTKHLLAKSK
ncbi:hypothetical protein [Colwellia psychrerythraea]|uniref:Uncharacterized protein n=1 Tax=Colwellia psychrerythraea TaxID=28229 RepID=A0A099K7K2_COLPS|nr:hypothetical protein [Colwellia psychrerythraea]KGJ86754.1 hypothetical protein ND2E_0926 [Colwellia psychrerythraea]